MRSASCVFAQRRRAARRRGVWPQQYTALHSTRKGVFAKNFREFSAPRFCRCTVVLVGRAAWRRSGARTGRRAADESAKKAGRRPVPGRKKADKRVRLLRRLGCFLLPAQSDGLFHSGVGAPGARRRPEQGGARVRSRKAAQVSVACRSLHVRGSQTYSAAVSALAGLAARNSSTWACASAMTSWKPAAFSSSTMVGTSSAGSLVPVSSSLL